MATDPLVVDVHELLERIATRRAVTTTVLGEGLAARDARVPDGATLDVDLVLESVSNGITVTGTVRGSWEGECRRCLGPARGGLVAEVHELYQAEPGDEDAFPLEGERLDLRPMVRELTVLELPLAPVCRADCLGLCPTCGVDRNVEPCSCATSRGDPRWAALDELRGRLEQPG